MKLSRLFTEDDAVSSTIGVVLMVAVTVILAAAVGTFALDLAQRGSQEIPSASVETKWGEDGGSDTLDVTVLGGNELEKRYLSVRLEGTVIYDESGTSGDFTVYDGKSWSSTVKSGDTLGLKETTSSGFQDGDTVKVVWNNGEKSQVLGSGTLQA